jgi:hypothetical protein
MFAAALSALCHPVVGQDPNTDPALETTVKCTTEHLDKSWNLGVKSCVAKEVELKELGDRKFEKGKVFQQIRITLEFVDDPGAIREIRRRFVIESKLPKVGEPALKEPQTQLYLFDGDNVLLDKLEIQSIEGEITGVKGDAFRIISYCDRFLFPKVKKIELRPAKQ